MLPLLRPEFFPSEMVPWAGDWIGTVAEVATGVVCISRTVADELYEWLTRAKPLRAQPLSLGYFHLGADLHGSLPTKGASEDAAIVLAKLRSRPTFLMVGTVELPRDIDRHLTQWNSFGQAVWTPIWPSSARGAG